MLRPVSPSEPSSPLRAPETNRTPSPPLRDPSAAGRSGHATLMTPAPGDSARRKFLETELGSKDLADLADMVDRTAQPWAFTGSTALKLWGHKLDYPEAKNIVPADADIVTTETGVDIISREKVSTGAEDEALKARGETFKFSDTLSVDLLASSAYKPRFGNLQHDVETHRGTPFMSLEVLRKTRTAANRVAGEFGDHLKVRRGTDHLVLINRLIEMSASSPPRGPTTQSAVLRQRITAGASSAQAVPMPPQIPQEEAQEQVPRIRSLRRKLDFGSAGEPRQHPPGA